MLEEEQEQNQEENEISDDREILSLEEERAFEIYKRDVAEAYKKYPSINEIPEFKEYMKERRYPIEMITEAITDKYSLGEIKCPCCKYPVRLEITADIYNRIIFRGQCKCGSVWQLQEMEE